MVNIIPAKEAFNESKYRKKADEILTEIIMKIKEACEQGCFQISINIDSRTETGVIDLVINDLKEKGYEAIFRKDNAPAYEDYWDYITINWNLS